MRSKAGFYLQAGRPAPRAYVMDSGHIPRSTSCHSRRPASRTPGRVRARFRNAVRDEQDRRSERPSSARPATWHLAVPGPSGRALCSRVPRDEVCPDALRNCPYDVNRMPPASRLSLSLGLLMALAACGLVEPEPPTTLRVGSADARPVDDARPESRARDADAKVDSGIPCAACGPVCPNAQVCIAGFCGAAPDAGTMCNGVFCAGTCAAGRCRVALLTQRRLSEVPLVGPTIYADDAHLYWVDAANAILLALRLTDGATTKLSTQSGGNVSSFTRDSTSVYFSQAYFSGSTPENVVKVPLCGGSRTTLASGIDLINSALVVTDGNVFWSNGPALDGVPVDGGPIVTVPDASVAAADATNLYYFSFTNMDRDAWVTKVPIAGGTPVTLASFVGSPTMMVVDANNVYWSSSDMNSDGFGTVMSVPIGGGTATTLASGVLAPMSLALDEATVYFTAPNDAQHTGGIMSVPLAGGPSSRSPRAPRLPGSP